MINADFMPQIRAEHLVMTDAGDDLLVYDTADGSLHTLNALTAQVLRLCDGQTSVRDIAVVTGLSADMVNLALAQLAQANLLETAPVVATPSRSRRSLVKKVGMAAAIPAIVSITAPLASRAHSGCIICNLMPGAGGVDTCPNGGVCHNGGHGGGIGDCCINNSVTPGCCWV